MQPLINGSKLQEVEESGTQASWQAGGVLDEVSPGKWLWSGLGHAPADLYHIPLKAVSRESSLGLLLRRLWLAARSGFDSLAALWDAVPVSCGGVKASRAAIW